MAAGAHVEKRRLSGAQEEAAQRARTAPFDAQVLENIETERMAEKRTAPFAARRRRECGMPRRWIPVSRGRCVQIRTYSQLTASFGS
jgi:hypothetical protein